MSIQLPGGPGLGSGLNMDGTSPVDPIDDGSVVPWAASTRYVRGALALNPSGQLIRRKSSGVSGATYDSSLWDIVGGSGGGTVDKAAVVATGVSVTDLGGKTSAQSDATYAPIAQKGVDPNDVGLDIYLLMGQSNMSGRGVELDSRIDITHPRVFQYGNPGSVTLNAYSGVWAQAVEPLQFHDFNSNTTGAGLALGRRLADASPSNRRVGLLPLAHGGIGLTPTNTLSWNPTMSPTDPNALYPASIGYIKAALAAAGSGARVVGAFWVQGEQDASLSVSGATYRAAIDAFVAQLRTDLGLPSLPFTIGQMVPDYLGGNTRQAINDAQTDQGARMQFAAFARGPVGYTKGDTFHYSTAGYRGPCPGQKSLAHSLFDGHRRALLNVTGVAALVPAAPTITQTSATAVTVAWSEVAGRATNYLLRYSLDGGTTWVNVTRAGVAALSVAWPLTGLTTGSTVAAQVASVNEQGTSAWSTSTVLTLAQTPNAVTSLSAGTPTANAIPLTWTAPASDGTHSAATSYLVEFKLTSGSTWTTFSTTTTTPYSSVNGLIASTAYDVRVTPSNGAGAGSATSVTNVTTAAAAYVIDAVGVSATRAFSVRKLRGAYAGSALQVRRSSDNTTQDIGFTTGGDLDTVALLAFVGAGNGFVSAWYDQSGNGYHVVNATAATQPRVVNAGAVDLSSGKAAINTSAVAGSFLEDATNPSSTVNLYAQPGVTMCLVASGAQPTASSFVVAESNASNNTGIRYGFGTGAGNSPYMGLAVKNDAGTQLLNQTGTIAVSNGAAHQTSVVDTTTQAAEWVDAASSIALSNYVAARTGTFTPNRFTVGGYRQNSATTLIAPWAGLLSELVIWPAALSTAQRQAAEASQKSYFGTA